MTQFKYQEMFERGPDVTPYRKLTSDFVFPERWNDVEILKVDPLALSLPGSRGNRRCRTSFTTRSFKAAKGNFGRSRIL